MATKAPRAAPRLAALKEFVSPPGKKRQLSDEPMLKATLYFPAQLHQDLKHFCIDNRTSVSALIVDLVRKHIAPSK